MKSTALLLSLSAALLTACTSTTTYPLDPTPSERGTAMPEPPTEQHRWLHQLVGEWDVVYESAGPEDQAFRFEAIESVRSLGGRWIVSEGSAGDFRSILTLGYDPDQGHFLGTWVDTNQTRLWQFQGELTESGDALHLHADGPSMFQPEETARYREALELLGPNQKRVTSSTLQPDGTWTTFLTATATRRE